MVSGEAEDGRHQQHQHGQQEEETAAAEADLPRRLLPRVGPGAHKVPQHPTGTGRYDAFINFDLKPVIIIQAL